MKNRTNTLGVEWDPRIGDHAPEFQPLFGCRPPYLAGREEHLRILARQVKQILSRQARGNVVLMYGPRGNGKTVLLNEFVRRTTEEHKRLKVLCDPASPNAQTDENLILWLTPQDQLIEETTSVAEELKIGVSSTSGTMRTDDGKVYRIPIDTQIAIEKCIEAGPTVIALDEAQTIPVPVLRNLFSAAQKYIQSHPVLFLFVGTPDLPDHVSEAATFSSRVFHKIGVDILSDQEAREAFLYPLDGLHIELNDEIESEALELVSRYPYFIQLLGTIITEIHSQEATNQDSWWPRARAAFNVKKRNYFRYRYIELGHDSGLREVCHWIANHFSEHDRLEDSQLDARVENALTISEYTTMDEIQKSLVHVGFIWRNPNEEFYRPGIPSLMSYYKEAWEKQKVEASLIRRSER